MSILHSDRTQRERDKALKDFKDCVSKILVATDIASRGLDISNVGYVINFNVPEHSEDYVHRIGRTGRANREGKAVTLFSSDETEFLKRIESFIGEKSSAANSKVCVPHGARSRRACPQAPQAQ